MAIQSRCGIWTILLIIFMSSVGTIFDRIVSAQDSGLQQKIAEIKDAAAKNKQALAQYNWVEQVTISLKGEQKKQEHFQVRLGPDGKPQKTSLDSPAPAAAPEESGGRRGGRLKEHVVEKKKEEYKEYADQIKALIEKYVPPEKEMLQEAFQKGNVSLAPEAASPGQYRLVFSNYIKQGDNMTLVIDKAQKDLSSISIATYLDDAKDAVNVLVQFGTVPGGPNHIATEKIDGVGKQLTIAVQNSNYQHL